MPELSFIKKARPDLGWFGGFKLVNVILALIFALLYISFDWELIAGREFKDKANYNSYLEDNSSVLTYLDFNSFLDYVKAEWLWHYLIDVLVREGTLNNHAFFSFISFVIIFTYAFIVLSNANSWYLLFLFNPLIVDFGFAQFRNALSMAFLGLAIFTKQNALRYFLFLISIFIHTFSLFLIALFFISNFLINKFSNKKISLSGLRLRIISISVAIAFVLGPALSAILGMIGDRRVGEKDYSSSFSYLSFWMFSAFFFMINIKNVKINFFTVFALILLVSISLTIVTNGYSLRLLSTLFPFFIVTLASFNGDNKFILMGLFFIYTLLQWIFWLDLI